MKKTGFTLLLILLLLFGACGVLESNLSDSSATTGESSTAEPAATPGTALAPEPYVSLTADGAEASVRRASLPRPPPIGD